MKRWGSTDSRLGLHTGHNVGTTVDAGVKKFCFKGCAFQEEEADKEKWYVKGKRLEKEVTQRRAMTVSREWGVVV